MLQNPAVTVLMPVYNCELYVGDAVRSILNQTFSDFELLIIDDASTDKTAGIVKEFSDPRIRFIQKQVNSGYTDSLNYGIENAKGQYIARMDGDDISLPERLALQVEVLNRNPEIIVCGSQFQILGTDKVIQLPEMQQEILIALLLENPIAHPSVLLRKSALNGITYDKAKEPAEDYDLWSRLIWHGKFYNIQKTLLLYRIHSGQISITKSTKQLRHFNESRISMFKKLEYDLNVFPDTVIMKFLQQESGISPATFKSMIGWTYAIQEANRDKQQFQQKAFNDVVNKLRNELLSSFFLVNRHESKIVSSWLTLPLKLKIKVLKAYAYDFYKRIKKPRANKNTWE